MQLLTEQTVRSWLVRPEPRPQAGAHLFCLPYAGGGAAAYRPWLSYLPSTLELQAVQLPGREARLREQPLRRMDQLVAALAPVIEAQLDRPYALFGHSMGALIAFELARALRRLGAPPPLCLVVSGRRAPQLADPDPPLHQLGDGPFVRSIVRRYNGIPRVILEDIDLLRLFLPTLRADLELIETYQYADEAPLDCPIIAFGGQSDERASMAELAAWGAQSLRPLGARQLPGDHFFVQSARAELVPAIAAIISASAERSRA